MARMLQLSGRTHTTKGPSTAMTIARNAVQEISQGAPPNWKEARIRVPSATARPKSAEMIPGPGFRIRRAIDRPPRDLVNLYRRYETPDISDILNRMYT